MELTSVKAPVEGAKYLVCSDPYGHHIRVPDADADEQFIAAVIEGYENGTLHDTGHLAIDKGSNRLVFLVAVRLDTGAVVSEERLSEIAVRHGVPVVLLRAPDAGASLPGYLLVAAPLDRAAQFKLAYSLTLDILSTCEGQMAPNGALP